MNHLNEIVSLTKEIGASLQSKQRKLNWVQAKENGDFVSDLDLSTGRLISERLASWFPGDGIVCEDLEAKLSTTGKTWYIDPIDGTTNFIHGNCNYTVSIACFDALRNIEEFGVVYAPALNQLFLALKDKNDTSCGVPNIKINNFKNALMLYGLRKNAAPNCMEVKKMIEINYECDGLRRSGCASLDICHVASGFAEAYFHYSLSYWDIAAGILFARNAGLKIGNIGSGDYNHNCPSILVAVDSIYKELSDRLRLTD